MSAPYIPFYPSDWLAGTRGLTAAETGVYITLVAMMYERDGAIQMDDKRLARLCGCTVSTFRKIISVLCDEGKIIEDDSGLWNERAQKEIKNRQEKSQKNSQNANARWQKSQQKQQPKNAVASNSQCETDAYQNQNQSKKEEPKGSSQKKRGSRLPDDWSLPKDWGEWAVSEGWPEQAIRSQADRFRDYWISQPGQKAVKVDWFATWRNWMRNSNAPKVLDGGQHGQRFDATDRIQRTVTAAARGSSGQDWG